MEKKFTVGELRGVSLYLRARADGIGAKLYKPKRLVKREQLLRAARTVVWAADQLEKKE